MPRRWPKRAAQKEPWTPAVASIVMRSASGKLNRAIVMLGAMALGGALIFAWIFFAREQQESSRSNFHNSVQEAVTNPVQFAKERITGGIGTALGMDTSNGLP